MAKAPRRRRRWIWLGLLPALLLVGLLAVRWLLEPERLSGFLLRQASQATGLQLALSEPAGVGFWPDLHLELTGLEARAPGTQAPILRVQRVDAVLPWSAVASDEFSLRSLRVVAPRLEWTALQAWLATRTSSGTPPRLPRVDAAFEVSDGVVAGDDWMLDGIAFSLPSLRPGVRIESEIVARIATPAFELPLDVTLSALPREVADGLRFDDVAIAWRAFELTDSEALDTQGLDAIFSAAKGEVSLEGSASMLRSGISFALRGGMHRWPDEWPTLPLPPTTGPVRIAIAYSASKVTFALDRADDRIESEFALGDLGAWFDDPDATLIPPLAGTAKAQRLQFGGVELHGVQLDIQDDDDASP